MPDVISDQGSVSFVVRRSQAAVTLKGGGGVSLAVQANSGASSITPSRGVQLKVQQKQAALAAGVQAVGLVRKQFYVQDSVPAAVPGLPLLLLQTGQTADPQDVIPKVIL